MNGLALNNIQNAYVGSTPAQAIYLGSTLIWPTTPPHDYSQDYLTIVSLANNNPIVLTCSLAGYELPISVSTDDGATWVQYTSSTSGTTLATLNTGDKVLIKGSNPTYAVNGSYYHTLWIYTSANIEGNIMSLIYGDNFIGQTSLGQTGSFERFFDGGFTSAENLILPATTLNPHCYSKMFSLCTSLVTAPELPATTLADWCYSNMFYGCSSLVTAPELPATTLADYCYQNMFDGCTLTTAPELPATTLADYCYIQMFNGCLSLTTAPELPATTLAQGCYLGMFMLCTSLVTAPELPATTLADSCYYQMFEWCSSLNNIKCLATDISASYCINRWLESVSSTGTFVKATSMASWTTGDTGIPSGWTITNA